MGNIWFTADHHFGHENIIKYCNRPFSSVEEMDEVMIQRWNEDVESKDTVYYLGDFTLSNPKFAGNIRRRLNGLTHWIMGSHDNWLSSDALRLMQVELKVDENKHPYTFVLCHYAMRVWEKSHYGSFHLYGHSHGTLPGLGRSMDVGVDTNNFRLYNIDEIVEKLLKIEPHNAPKDKGRK